jgi:hypothetical protein
MRLEKKTDEGDSTTDGDEPPAHLFDALKQYRARVEP